MKKHYYILFAALALLASCMGESGDVWIYGSQTGVIRGDAEKYIQLYSGDRVTSDALQTRDIKFRFSHLELNSIVMKNLLI